MTATTTKPPADPLAQLDALEAKRRAKAQDTYTALVCELAHNGKTKRTAKAQLDVCEAAGKSSADLRADVARASEVLKRLKLAQEHEERWAVYTAKTAEWRKLQAELKAETKRLEAAIEAAGRERSIAHAAQAETGGARAELGRMTSQPALRAVSGARAKLRDLRRRHAGSVSHTKRAAAAFAEAGGSAEEERDVEANRLGGTLRQAIADETRLARNVARAELALTKAEGVCLAERLELLTLAGVEASDDTLALMEIPNV